MSLTWPSFPFLSPFYCNTSCGCAHFLPFSEVFFLSLAIVFFLPIVLKLSFYPLCQISSFFLTGIEALFLPCVEAFSLLTIRTDLRVGAFSPFYRISLFLSLMLKFSLSPLCYNASKGAHTLSRLLKLSLFLSLAIVFSLSPLC